ncbi:MAG: T9SS type A sorting domain-containing protein [Bacteroidetes bacterium]|nr:T9SS type A sorting domain-containing protein [Bacteroidota bacterium]
MNCQEFNLSERVLRTFNYCHYLRKKGFLLLFFVVLLFNVQAQIQIQFEEVMPVNAPLVQASASSVAFADIDGDNDQDVLISGNYFDGTLQIVSNLYTNDGAGNFTLLSGAPFTGVRLSSVAFADIDGDNDQDLLITGDKGSFVGCSELYVNDGVGNYTLVAATPFDAVIYSSVAFADIDGDNDQDVLITGYNGSARISKLYTNDGTGIFSLVSGTPFQGVNSGSVAFADIDNDDDQDVLITGYNGSTGTSNLYINDGLGNYSLDTSTPFDTSREGFCAFADIDGDNDQDVLITGFNGTSEFSKLYRNDGTGQFSLATGTPLIGVYHSDVAFADIDGDDDQDVLISGWNGTIISSNLYINDGTGVYTLEGNVGFENVYEGSLAFADIDGDDDQDLLITGNNGAGAISKLYRNNTCSATTGTDVITACDSITWIDGITYTASNNTATYTLTNAAGCDSVVTLDLTVHYSNTGVDIITACDSITWIDGITYTASNNTATYTLTNAAGCDSVVTLDLTVHYSNAGIDIITACDSYTWIDGITYTASNNTATYTLTNVAGCDSVVTLDLTVNYSNTGVDIITACDSYTWIDGITYTASNNTATYSLTNVAGCDSVVMLDLTIDTVDVSVTVTDPTITANATNASYQWLDCTAGYAIIPGETAQSFTATTNGDYAVEVTANNCIDTSVCVTITTVGLSETSGFNTVFIYPNPIQEMVHIQLGTLTDVSIKILNVQGKLIYAQEHIHTPDYHIEFNEEPGIYFVELSANEQVRRYKLIKQ